MALVLMALVAPGCTSLWGGGDEPRFMLQESVGGLDQPVAVAFDTHGTGFIVQQNGTILRWDGGASEPDVFLDLSSRLIPADERYWEQGLLDAEWHPEDPGRLFVAYTPERAQPLLEHRTVLAEYAYDATNGSLEPAGILLDVPKTYPWHNGGHIEFGPDGHLCFSVGDGSTFGRCNGFNDPAGNAQEPRNLLGTIVRITPAGPGNYTVPADNPFVGDASGRDEVWMYGMRNPFRFHFAPDGALWIGDVGAFHREEIDRVPPGHQAGANLGWPWFEGHKDISHCGDEPHPSLPPGGVDRDAYVSPVWDYPYPDSDCAAVAAGVLHDGSSLPELAGAFVYGDLCLQRLWALRPEGDGWRNERVADAPDVAIVAVEQAPDGRILVVDWQGGSVLALAARHPTT